MSSLKVAVRCRPFNQREIDMDSSEIVEMDGKKTRLNKTRTLAIRDSGRENHHDFTFDFSYWSFNEKDEHFATQEQVYDDLGNDVVDCAFQGYNACVFAYGQTGSGKTFTMMGKPDNPGLIPRICQELFARMRVGHESGTGYKTHASYLEIYNERVKDLLGPQSSGHNLRVREHRSLGPYVENLSQHAVSDFNEIQECISQGNTYRTTASTNMNDTSSRSHAIFTITFVQAIFMNDMPSETVSKIHLVDLAGSERANATGATGQRLKEGAHINKSLVTLGSVISALAEQANRNCSNQKPILYIPYRDSILTWLLKDSLGGNSKTIMIAAISPADCNYSETLSTLRYANRAKNIINKPTINEDPNVKLIRELRDEINKLKSLLSTGVSKEGSKLLEDLLKKEAQEKVLTEEWTEKWKEAQSILQEQKSLGLRKAGAGGVTLDSEMPHLIGIHNDSTTGVTLYSLKDGETIIGTDESDESEFCNKISLTGNGIQSQHCSIVIKDGHATLYPKPQAQCWLNANLINEPIPISQGDIILLGRTNIFRFNNPAEVAKLRQKDTNPSCLDISRLSLITASRENLLNSSAYGDDELFSNIGMNNSFNSPYKREKQYFPAQFHEHDDPELQDENRKILATIENALKQLNIERVQMHQQYKNKVKKLTEQLECLEHEENNAIEIFRCKEKELLARRDMLVWEKNNEKIQIDIVCTQISALQTQLDSKKRDFSEYVAKELQELQDCDKLDEAGIKLSGNTPLSDELLLQVSESLNPAAALFIRDTIKRNNDDIRKLDEEIFEKEKLLNSSTERIAILDEKILKLDKELNDLHDNPNTLNLDILRQKKQSMNLNLKGIPECDVEAENKIQDETGNSDTYHTANSDCSNLASTSTTPLFVGDNGDVSPKRSKFSSVRSNTLTNDSPPPVSSNVFDPLMSDSGVCLDSVRPRNLESQIFTTNGQELKVNDDDTGSCCSSYGNGSRKSSFEDLDILQQNFPNCRMHKLKRKIFIQKALIMKNLEKEVNKHELDDQIAQLQELQKSYIKLEKIMQVNNGEHTICCIPGTDERYEDNVEERTYTVDREHMLSRFSARNSVAESSSSLSKSFSSMHNIDEYLSIPSYVVRGAGNQTHYEYEIRISLPDGNLNLLRRFSRFRELHLAMKNIYGTKVNILTFPRRELFSSNSESVAKQRRRLLEQYLRRLLIICSKIPQCPIYEGDGGHGLTKQSLATFSSFFKKGLFESGKHGTG